MGKTSGSTTGGLGRGDGNYKGEIKGKESLKNIQNPAVYKAVKEAISRVYSVLGAKERNVKLATLRDGVGGVHSASYDAMSGQKLDSGVYLNKKIFKPKTATTQSVAKWAKGGYDSGHLTKTNKPVAHIVTHEMAHAIWTDTGTSPQQRAARKDIGRLYSTWLKDNKKTGYGKYARTNVSEFWAETCTKAVHGTSDKYTKRVKAIIKKYSL